MLWSLSHRKAPNPRQVLAYRFPLNPLKGENDVEILYFPANFHITI